MNGRTCQLCGKALSRFTVGSGGDFCSREHRNQFRLRLGMDRLVEANKVANLMRRRENAKSIPASQLVRDSKVSPRVAPLLRMPMRQPDVRPMRPLAAALPTPMLASRSKLSRLRQQPAKAMNSEARSIEARDFGVRLKRLLPPPAPGDGFRTQMAPAGAVLPRLSGARLAKLRREVSQLRLVLHRTHVGGNGIQVRPLHLPPQNPQEPQPARRLNNSAGRGRELRVSGGIGFRLIAPRIRKVEFPHPHTSPPGRSTNARGLTSSIQPKKSPVMPAEVMRFTVRVPAAPKGPTQNNPAAFRWPDALPNGRGPARSTVPVSQSCDVTWEAPPMAAPQLRCGNGSAGLRAVTPQAPSLPAPGPRGMSAGRRATEVAFQPQETPFQCPSDLHGTLLSSMHFGAAPIRKVDSAPAAMEEHFDTGLNNWVGGTADWKVDVAGVRPGSLALYSPSLDMANYQLEFLTRIEQRGMSWVFRAANYKDYYKVTLAVAQGGGYEIPAPGGDGRNGGRRHGPRPTPGDASPQRQDGRHRTHARGGERFHDITGWPGDRHLDRCAPHRGRRRIYWRAGRAGAALLG